MISDDAEDPVEAGFRKSGETAFERRRFCRMVLRLIVP